MERGFSLVAHGGTYVLVSIVQGNISFSDPEFHKREMTLLSSRNATLADFATVMTAMRDGHVPTRAIKTHSAPLWEVGEEDAGMDQAGGGDGEGGAGGVVKFNLDEYYSREF